MNSGAGSQQKFCSKCGRMAFHVEARQVGYRMVNAPGLRPDRLAPARRTRRRRANAPGRAPDPEGVPIEIIQQKSDLTVTQVWAVPETSIAQNKYEIGAE